MQRFLQHLVVAVLLVLSASVCKSQVFVQQGSKLYAVGGLGPAIYGTAVGLSADGNVAIIGASGDNVSMGAAYIVRRAGTTWTQEAKLVGTPDASPYQPYQGNAVAISADGNTVIVGGYNDNLHGSVWIYRYIAGAWTMQIHIQGTPGQRYGTSVSLSADGNTALIGNYYDNSAEVWQYSGTAWNKEAVITCSDAVPSGTGAINAMVGISVSLSADGNTALIGGNNDSNGTGAVWIFTHNGSSWIQQGGKITAAGISAGSNFGHSVALSGDARTALVGAYGEESIYVFTYNGSAWTQQGGKLIPNDIVGPSHLGGAVSISADGNTALVGASIDNSAVGASWIFIRTGNTWTQSGNKLIGSGFTTRANQGTGVALSADGKTALIGGPKDDSYYGSAWVFVPAAPTIATGAVTGTMTACQGAASVSPNIQQFTVTGSYLTGDITATAPSDFEISLNPASGYSNALTLNQTGGNANGIIYVRAAATATPGNIAGNVTLTSAGAITQTVAVAGIVSAIPIVANPGSQSFGSGQFMPGINFSGSVNTTYSWTNDNTASGLAASGTGDIPPITFVNNGSADIVSTIQVIPTNSNGCSGSAISFTITVHPAVSTPVINISAVTGKIVGCMGQPSTSPNIAQFTVSGSSLTANIVLKTSSPYIDISTNPTVGYINTIDIAQINGTVAGVTIYVRSSGSALSGQLNAAISVASGSYKTNVSITGTINPLGILNTIPNQLFGVGISSSPINFTGTATSATWTNDNTAIGLPANGTGNIPSFIPTKTGMAHVTVTPINANGCNGAPQTFTINVQTAVPSTINASGSVAQLNTVYGTPSTSGVFTISGSSLTAGLTVTPPGGFEVSTDNIKFSKTITVGSAGAVPSTTVYIRLAKTAPVGTYPGKVVISSTGAASATIQLDNNSTVSQASLTITADDKSKIIGNPNPVFTATYTGFVNGETSAVLTTRPVLSTTATISSPLGTYPITASGAASPNYAITYVAGTMTVRTQPVGIVLSNAFTPNGDGVNDTWIIKNIEEFPNSVVRVYSRYGTPVFYSVNYAEPWDGKRNGSNLPIGTYYYIIDLKNGDKPTAGWVAILR